MPSVEQNRNLWDGSYDWSQSGEEWSQRWGSPEFQWRLSLEPRLQRFLPRGHILEIAPGGGRWSHFLSQGCESINLVDLSNECIDRCRKRFGSDPRFSYHVGDGKSLDMIEDDSVDLVFSFDSLVHADAEVLESYVSQLPRILKDGGIAFIHHSNMEEYSGYFGLCAKLPYRVRRFMQERDWIQNDGWREPSMSAERFETFSRQAGLELVSQEKLNWTGTRLIDCISVCGKNVAGWTGETRRWRNSGFGHEADFVRQLCKTYGP